jgi:GNAT superfamily N-acetyltransferase
VCEDARELVKFMLLMDRGAAAQLRYFILKPAYRGIGLGGKLMRLYIDFLKTARYTASYLWTTHELHSAAHRYKRAGFQLTEQKESTAFGKKLLEQKV